MVHAERAALVTSSGFRKRGLVEKVGRRLEGRLAHVLDNTTPNPSLDDIDELHRLDELDGVDAVIALGGGSVLDTAKALSRLLSYPRDESLPESFWKGVPSDVCGAVPIIAIPTTAGTGSEVTPTATIWDRRDMVKISLCGDDLYPSLAIVDPTLTHSLPEGITISSGLDAISHALESIWNKRASPLSILLATESLRLSIGALPELMTGRQNSSSRSSMMRASLLAGLAISQTRTALAHSISYPMSLEFDMPHGIACSFALPEILGFNAVVDDGRLGTLARELGFEDIERLGEVLRTMLEASLSSKDFPDELPESAHSEDFRNRMFTRGRMDNNLRTVGLDDLHTIISEALHRYGVR